MTANLSASGAKLEASAAKLASLAGKLTTSSAKLRYVISGEGMTEGQFRAFSAAMHQVG